MNQPGPVALGMLASRPARRLAEEEARALAEARKPRPLADLAASARRLAADLDAAAQSGRPADFALAEAPRLAANAGLLAADLEARAKAEALDGTPPASPGREREG